LLGFKFNLCRYTTAAVVNGMSANKAAAALKSMDKNQAAALMNSMSADKVGFLLMV
jgi:flagellar motility protein MotE (MotC chaperone)